MLTITKNLDTNVNKQILLGQVQRLDLRPNVSPLPNVQYLIAAVKFKAVCL